MLMPTPCSSGRSAYLVRFFPAVCCHTGVGQRKFLCLSYLSWYGSLYPLLWNRCSGSSQVFFRRNLSKCSFIFVLSMGRGKCKLFLCCHLELHSLESILERIFENLQSKNNTWLKKRAYLSYILMWWMIKCFLLRQWLIFKIHSTTGASIFMERCIIN